MSEKKRRITVPGSRLVETVRELIARPETRRVCLIHEEKRLLEVPQQIYDPMAPAAALKAPLLAALNAFAALVNECTVEVEEAEKKKAGD